MAWPSSGWGKSNDLDQTLEKVKNLDILDSRAKNIIENIGSSLNKTLALWKWSNKTKTVKTLWEIKDWLQDKINYVNASVNTAKKDYDKILDKIEWLQESHNTANNQIDVETTLNRINSSSNELNNKYSLTFKELDLTQEYILSSNQKEFKKHVAHINDNKLTSYLERQNALQKIFDDVEQKINHLNSAVEQNFDNQTKNISHISSTKFDLDLKNDPKWFSSNFNIEKIVLKDAVQTVTSKSIHVEENWNNILINGHIVWKHTLDDSWNYSLVLNSYEDIHTSVRDLLPIDMTLTIHAESDANITQTKDVTFVIQKPSTPATPINTLLTSKKAEVVNKMSQRYESKQEAMHKKILDAQAQKINGSYWSLSTKDKELFHKLLWWKADDKTYGFLNTYNNKSDRKMWNIQVAVSPGNPGQIWAKTNIDEASMYDLRQDKIKNDPKLFDGFVGDEKDFEKIFEKTLGEDEMTAAFEVNAEVYWRHKWGIKATSVPTSGTFDSDRTDAQLSFTKLVNHFVSNKKDIWKEIRTWWMKDKMSGMETQIQQRLNEVHKKNHESLKKQKAIDFATQLDSRFTALPQQDKDLFSDLLAWTSKDVSYADLNTPWLAQAEREKAQLTFPVNKSAVYKIGARTWALSDRNMHEAFLQSVLEKAGTDSFDESEFKDTLQKYLSDEELMKQSINDGITSGWWSADSTWAVESFKKPVTDPASFTTDALACQTAFKSLVNVFVWKNDQVRKNIRTKRYKDKVDATPDVDDASWNTIKSHEEKLKDVYYQQSGSTRKDAFWKFILDNKDTTIWAHPLFDVKDAKHRTPEVKDFAYKMIMWDYDPVADTTQYPPAYSFLDTTSGVTTVIDPATSPLKDTFVLNTDDFVTAFKKSVIDNKDIKDITQLNSYVSENLDTNTADVIKNNLHTQMNDPTRKAQLLSQIANIRDHIVKNEERRKNVPRYDLNVNQAKINTDSWSLHDLDKIDNTNISTFKLDVTFVNTADFAHTNPWFQKAVDKRVQRIKKRQWIGATLNRRLNPLTNHSRRLKEEARRQLLNEGHMLDERSAMAERAKAEYELGLLDNGVAVRTNVTAGSTYSSARNDLEQRFAQHYASNGSKQELDQAINDILRSHNVDGNIVWVSDAIHLKTQERYQFLQPLLGHMTKIKTLLKNDPQRNNPATQQAMANFLALAKKLDDEFKKNNNWQSPQILKTIVARKDVTATHNTDVYMKLLDYQETMVNMVNTKVEIGELHLLQWLQIRSADHGARDTEKYGVQKARTRKFAEHLEHNPALRIVWFGWALASMAMLGIPGLVWWTVWSWIASLVWWSLATWAVAGKMLFSPIILWILAAFEAKWLYNKEIQLLRKKLGKMSKQEYTTWISWVQNSATNLWKQLAVAQEHNATHMQSAIARLTEKWSDLTPQEVTQLRQQLAHAYSFARFRHDNEYRNMWVIKDEATFNKLMQSIKAWIRRYNTEQHKLARQWWAAATLLSMWTLRGFADSSNVTDRYDDETMWPTTMNMQQERADIAARIEDNEWWNKWHNLAAFAKATWMWFLAWATSLLVQQALQWLFSAIGIAGAWWTEGATDNAQNWWAQWWAQWWVDWWSGWTWWIENGWWQTTTITDTILTNPALHSALDGGAMTTSQYDAFVSALNDPSNANSYLRDVVNDHVTWGNQQATNRIVQNIRDAQLANPSALADVQWIFDVPWDSWFNTMAQKWIINHWDIATYKSLLIQLDNGTLDLSSINTQTKHTLMNLVYRSDFDRHSIFGVQDVQVQQNVVYTWSGSGSTVIQNTWSNIDWSVLNNGSGVAASNAIDRNTAKVTIGSESFSNSMLWSPNGWPWAAILSQQEYSNFWRAISDPANVNASLAEVLQDAWLQSKTNIIMQQLLNDPTIMQNYGSSLQVPPIEDLTWTDINDNLSNTTTLLHNAAWWTYNPSTDEIYELFAQFKNNPSSLTNLQKFDVFNILSNPDLVKNTAFESQMLDPQKLLPLHATNLAPVVNPTNPVNPINPNSPTNPNTPVVWPTSNNLVKTWLKKIWNWLASLFSSQEWKPLNYFMQALSTMLVRKKWVDENIDRL